MNTHRAAGRVPIIPPRGRQWLYGVAAAAAPLAIAYGYVTEQQAPLWLNLAGSVLFIMALGNTPARPSETTEDDEQ